MAQNNADDIKEDKSSFFEKVNAVAVGIGALYSVSGGVPPDIPAVEPATGTRIEAPVEKSDSDSNPDSELFGNLQSLAGEWSGEQEKKDKTEKDLQEKRDDEIVDAPGAGNNREFPGIASDDSLHEDVPVVADAAFETPALEEYNIRELTVSYTDKLDTPEKEDIR